MIRSLTFASLVLLLLAGCATKDPEVKSPCAGAAGSPCDDRRPVNDWWLS